MKKVLSVLTGVAAIGGAAWLLYRKFGKPDRILVSEEFEEDEPIFMDETNLDEDFVDTDIEENQ